MQYLLTQEELDSLKEGIDEKVKNRIYELNKKVVEVLRKHQIHASELHYNRELENLIKDLSIAINK